MIEGDSYLLIVLVWVEESCDKKMMWDTYFDDDCDSDCVSYEFRRYLKRNGIIRFVAQCILPRLME